MGDIDGDGVDEIYVCQPGGLPNRLLKFAADGTLSDLSAAWGVDMLDDTSCALFLDLRNTGRQDLVVLRGGGPVLFLHEGERYRMRTDAFQFREVPKGGFTGMAAADFDCDGRLDLYLCCYVYFQSEAQYTYASPYHDAQNGPPNYLFRNRLADDGSGFFEDCTEETGIKRTTTASASLPPGATTTTMAGPISTSPMTLDGRTSTAIMRGIFVMSRLRLVSRILAQA